MKHLLFFQTGDYGEAYRRLQGGGPETYRDQRASVDFVASLRDRFVVTTVGIAAQPYAEDLAPNLFAMGITDPWRSDPAVTRAAFDRVNPDLMVLRTPYYEAMAWAKAHGTPTLLSFADFFSNRPAGQIINNLKLRHLLSSDIFPCVSNHNLNACLSVAHSLLYPKDRIVPWDWLPLATELITKNEASEHRRIFFAGTLSDKKGVGDCLNAAAHLKRNGITVHFSFAGPGNIGDWQERASGLELDDTAVFLGVLPHDRIRQLMRDSDIVVVPSRSSYAEGMPSVIYEALASRTPLIVSDHPAFKGRLRDGDECLIFREANPADLATKIMTLCNDATLYAKLSHNSAVAYRNIYFGVEWSALVRLFLDDPMDKSGWVQRNSVSALLKRQHSGQRTYYHSIPD